MPEGSSSAAPVISPGPSCEKNPCTGRGTATCWCCCAFRWVIRGAVLLVRQSNRVVKGARGAEGDRPPGLILQAVFGLDPLKRGEQALQHARQLEPVFPMSFSL